MIATPHLVGYTEQEDVINESCWTRELAAKPAELCEKAGLKAKMAAVILSVTLELNHKSVPQKIQQHSVR